MVHVLFGCLSQRVHASVLLYLQVEPCDAFSFDSKACSPTCRLSWEKERADLEASQAIDRHILLSFQEWTSQPSQQAPSDGIAPAPTARPPQVIDLEAFILCA